MTQLDNPAVPSESVEPRPIIGYQGGSVPARGSLFLLLRTTDHRLIGRMYIVTSFAFFLLHGVMALLLRARPGRQLLSHEQYNRLFTMHGTIMLPPFATPIVFPFANLVLPLEAGAPDVASPG